MSPSELDSILETLLLERGLPSSEVEDFLHPDYKKLHDPLLLPDMEKARDRVIRAMRDKEHIMVFSDYDADGIPGAVVFSDFFHRADYDKVSFYIPHRHDEGFGLNCDAIDAAAEKGATLLITIDCGIADLHEVEYANEKGIEVIITDHHLPVQADGRELLPKAFAIVDHKRKDSTYPFPELCGAAVGFKLIQAVLMKERFGIKEGMEKWSLDMVGIATLSDMVPLVGENRIFAKYGLDVLKKSPRPGLASLFKKLNMDQAHISEDDIAFMITPRINAASRMGKPEDAFRLLSTRSPLEAEKLALHLEKINNERKGVVAGLVKEAKAHLATRQDLPKVIVIGNPEWRPSLLGLVANTLVEEYSRPVFVWGRDGDGVLKGSCRSYNGYHLHDLMSGAAECFIEYGGHAGAGGFSLTLENVSRLEKELSKAIELLEEGESKKETKGIALNLAHIGERLWDTIDKLSPFGTGNPKPIFHIDAEVKSAKNFGKTGDHLEVILRSPGGRDVKAISFFTTLDSIGVPLDPGNSVAVTAHLEKSYFRNRPELRLRIIDIIGA
ncbi:MAG: recJ [Parcubacteria group bacterium]|nr:recJ [Parcubacteria group bacterium]